MQMTTWSEKDKRQYEHVKDSTMASGDSEDDAQEIAARTVNKQRREEGRTPNKTTQGTGNPNLEFRDRSVQELRNLAANLKIDGRSKMNKAELVQAIAKTH